MLKTLNDVYLDLRNEMRQRGIAGAQIEARELVLHAFKLTSDEFQLKRGMMVFERDIEKVAELAKIRYSGVPIQHITGKWEFYSLELDVSEDTLIPRSDTETLVDTAIAFLENRDKGRILDLCCGSGCVGIAVLKNVSGGINGVFADMSDGALRIARKNILRHNLTVRAITIKADAKEPHSESGGKYNLIVCNPPYIPTKEIETLDAEVKCEPRIALDGGDDGLDFYRAIAQNYKKALNKSGALMFEVGLGQAYDVKQLMQDAGFANVKFANDLTGVERVVWGTLE